MADDRIDATSDALLEDGGQPGELPSTTDPAMAITVALANELQQVYKDNPQALESANRTLRAATGKQPPQA